MQAISYADMFRTFGRIGVLSFGGPAAQIALMEDELVNRRKWLTSDAFLRALSFCMLLPGPEAMQLATYAGWRLRGTLGGLLAGVLFVAPGALVIFALAALYLRYGQIGVVQAAFLGVQATVIVVVFQALWRLANRALSSPWDWAIALASFFSIFLIGLPFPVIVLGAALLGFARARSESLQPQAKCDTQPSRATRPLTLVAWALAWVAPIVILWWLEAEFLSDVALFFAKLAVVTFGGAYAVLAYMTQQVVTDFGWLSTQQMIDALGLAETTPGPLILVTQFVGTVAGAAKGGLGYGVLAGAITLWVTFVPCFLWVFAGAPYLERITANARLNSALKSITAAVVGVILNLSLWFTLHVVFQAFMDVRPFWAQIPVPHLASVNALALVLIAGATALLFRTRMPLPAVLFSVALCAAVAHFLGLGGATA